MTDESVKKPGFVLNKKKNDAVSEKPASSGTATERKRVVIVKKTQSGNAPAGSVPQHPVAKKTVSAVNSVPQKKEVKPAVEAATLAATSAERQPVSEAKSVPAEEKKAPVTFELNSKRPNVKAGNLSDHPRSGNNGSRNNGFRNQRGYGNNQGYQRREGGFTGAQAREGYQNRERGDGQNGYSRNGSFQNRGFGGGQGGNGFRSGNFQNRQGNGGFNRNGASSGKPGFSGQRNGGQGGGFRPGMGGPRSAAHAPAAPLPEVRSAGKKAYKGKKQQVYSRKDKEDFFDESTLYENKKKNETPASVVPKQIDIMETVSVSDLAKKMNLKASDIIAKLMGMGEMVTITQSIDHETASLLAAEYGCEVHLVSLYDETVIESETASDDDSLPRPPIVTVMGHVDHGKTKTLDAIRHSNVVAGEFGGITQHIGAYSVTTPKGNITFLDTPGHEAFTMMRARGAQVTDIVVLVVAADDGVMPQTLEAIHHAKDAKVPIIVAVNKIDKPEANPDLVKTQLSEQGLTPEEWGGDTQYVYISALKGQGIDELLEAILLQAEILELKSPVKTRAEGKIIESRVDQGRGVVSTVIVQKGTLHQGDPFVAGIYAGRVRAMFNDYGKRIKEAGPSTPVEVLGMEEMPNAGDPFQVTENEKDARSISTKRQELKRFEAAKAVKKTTLDSLYTDIANNEVKELKVVIKADVQGSAEALKASLEKLSTKDIRLVVIHSSAGAINESDVLLAAADSNAFIIGFNVRPTPKAKLLADQEKVDIRKYNIIYKCVEEVTLAMEGMLKPDTREETVGTIEVRDTFKVPKVGVIAGCYVTDGYVKRSSIVNLIREGIVLFTGKITSLKRYKDDAKEVKAGFECGIGLENWQDIKVGDQLEVLEYVEIARKLGDTLVDEKAEAERKASERAATAKAEAEAAAEAEREQLAAEKAAGKAKKAAMAKKTLEGNL